MITAIVQNRGNTLVVDLPRSPFNLCSCLNSIGIMGNPPMVYIADDKNRDPHVRLFSKSVIGQHLISLFSQEDNLLAVNTVAHLVENADPAFQPKLVDKLLSGTYTTARDFVLDYDKMTHDAGPIKISFFFPICGTLFGEDGFPNPAEDRYLYAYRKEINDAIAWEQNRIGDLAAFFNGSQSIKDKLASAIWTTEDIGGSIFGRVDLRLREPLSKKETAEMKQWISSQNSDGAYESLEYHPIETEYGDLSLSLWSPKKDYFIGTREELDAHLENKSSMQLGGI